MSLLLTAAERIRFAEYLERSARDWDGMAEQLTKIGIMVPHGILAKHLRQKALAASIIAKDLRSAESMSMGGDST